MATGRMSARTIHPAKMTQARAAVQRPQTLAMITTAATAPASATRICAGAAKANDPPDTGNHCHGPPTDPGTTVSLISSQPKLSVDAAEIGIRGFVADVPSATASTTR